MPVSDPWDLNDPATKQVYQRLYQFEQNRADKTPGLMDVQAAQASADYKSTIDRIGITEKQGLKTLPTHVNLGLSQSALSNEQLGPTAAKLARSWDLSPVDLIGKNASLSQYVDPVTGGPVTLETAMRTMGVTEKDVIQNMLYKTGITQRVADERHDLNPTAPKVSSMITPDAVGKYMAILQSHRTGLSLAEAMAVAVGAAARGLKFDTFDHNMGIVSQLPEMDAIHQVSFAGLMTEHNYSLRDKQDAIGFIVPGARAALEETRAEGRYLTEMRGINTAQSSVPGFGGYTPPTLGATAQTPTGYSQYARGAPPTTGALATARGVTGASDLYAQINADASSAIAHAQAFSKELEVSKYRQAHSFGGKYIAGPLSDGIRWVSFPINEAIKGVEFGVVETAASIDKAFSWLPGNQAGFLKAPDSLGGNAPGATTKESDVVSNWYNIAHSVLKGQNSLGDVIAASAGLPRWSGTLLELGLQIYAMGEFGNFYKALRGGIELNGMTGDKLLSTVQKYNRITRAAWNGLDLPSYMLSIVPETDNVSAARIAFERGMTKVFGIVGRDDVVPAGVREGFLQTVLDARKAGATNEALAPIMRDFMDSVMSGSKLPYDAHVNALAEYGQFGGTGKMESVIANQIGTDPARVQGLITLGRNIQNASFDPQEEAAFVRSLDTLPDHVAIDFSENEMATRAAAQADATQKVVDSMIANSPLGPGLQFVHETPVGQLRNTIPGIRSLGVPLTNSRLGEYLGTQARYLTGQVLVGQTQIEDNPVRDIQSLVRSWKLSKNDLEAAVSEVMNVDKESNPFRSPNLKSIFDKYQQKGIDQWVARRGFASLDGDKLLAKLRARVDEITGAKVRTEGKAYGIKDVQGARIKGTKPAEYEQIAKAIAHPIETTDAMNTFAVLNPADLNIALNEIQTKTNQWRVMASRVFGEGKVQGTLSDATLRKFAGRMRTDFLKLQSSVWKPLVVVRPAYMLRVPLGEEQVKFLATLGLQDRLLSSKWVASGLQKISGVVEHDFLGQDIKLLIHPSTDLSEYGTIKDASGRWVAATPEAYAQKFGLDPEAVAAQLKDTKPIEVTFRPYYAGGMPRFAEASNLTGLTETASQQLLRENRALQRGVPKLMEPTTVDGKATEGHLREWARTLNLRYGQGELGAISLDGLMKGQDGNVIINNVEDFLRTPDGHKALIRMEVDVNHMSAVKLENEIQKIAKEHVDYLFRLTNGSSILARAALNGRVSESMLANFPLEKRPTITGSMAEFLNGKQTGIGHDISNRLGNLFVTMPHELFSHQPYTQVLFTDSFNQMMRMAAEDKITLTPQLARNIEQEARNYAATQMRSIMLDMSTHSRLSDMVATISPFFNPWEQFVIKWGHIAAMNPAAIPSLVNMYRTVKESGFISKDPVTGEDVIPVTVLRNLSTMFGLTNKIPGARLLTPVGALNMFFSDTLQIPGMPGGVGVPVPNLSVPMQAVLQKLVGPPEKGGNAYRVALANWLFHYGPSTMGGIAPSWLRHAMVSLFPNSGFSKGLLGAEGSLNSQADDLMKQYAFDHKGKQLDYKVAYDMARKLEVARAFWGLFSPGAPQVLYPQQVYENEYNSYASQHGYSAARDYMNQKYPDLTATTNAKTYWGRGALSPTLGTDVKELSLPATAEAWKIEQTKGWKDFAANNPELAFFMIPKEARQSGFDIATFVDQINSGVRKIFTPKQYSDNVQVQQGWDAFNIESERFKADLAAKGISEADSQKYPAPFLKHTEILNEIAKNFPTWGLQFGPGAAITIVNSIDPRVLMHLTNLDENSPQWLATEAGKASHEYLATRKTLIAAMEQDNIHSLDSVAARKAGLTSQYQDMVRNLTGDPNYTIGNPLDTKPQGDFAVLFRTYLQNDMQSLQGPNGGMTKGEQDYAALTDSQRTQVTQYQKQLDSLRNKAQGATGITQTKLFSDITNLENSAYTAYGKMNPQKIWWDNKTPLEQHTYELSLYAKPYIFLSQFDRQDILKLPTNPDVERKWQLYHQASTELSQLRADHPEYPSSKTKSLYASLDNYVKQLESGDKLFTQQVQAANQWGYSLRHSPYTQGSDPSARAWRVFFLTLDSVQAAWDKNKIHGSKYDGATFARSNSFMEEYVKTLFQYSPGFERQWRDMEQSNGYKTNLGWLIPDTYYRIGG